MPHQRFQRFNSTCKRTILLHDLIDCNFFFFFLRERESVFLGKTLQSPSVILVKPRKYVNDCYNVEGGVKHYSISQSFTLYALKREIIPLSMMAKVTKCLKLENREIFMEGFIERADCQEC